MILGVVGEGDSVGAVLCVGENCCCCCCCCVFSMESD